MVVGQAPVSTVVEGGAGSSRTRVTLPEEAWIGATPPDPVLVATTTAIRLLGRRVLVIDAEKAKLDSLLADLVVHTALRLLDLFGVGVDTAATLLVTADDNPARSARRPLPVGGGMGPSPYPPTFSARLPSSGAKDASPSSGGVGRWRDPCRTCDIAAIADRCRADRRQCPARTRASTNLII